MNHYYQISYNKDNYTKPFDFHSHDFYEIYFFVDGNVTYYIENENYTLQKGDVLIIPPGKLHRPVIESNLSYERYVLWIYQPFINSKAEFRALIKELNHMIVLKKMLLVSFQGEQFIEATVLFDNLLRKFYSNDDFALYTAQSCIVLIVSELLRELRLSEIRREEDADVIQQIIAYINVNVAHAPSLDELSEKFYLSKYYLSHKFKERTKTTLHRYILLKKINLAKQLLEKKSPKDVCDLCGFSTYSNFYKEFKRQTGVSPKNYKNF